MKTDKKEIIALVIILISPLILSLVIRYGLSSLYFILFLIGIFCITLGFCIYKFVIRFVNFLELFSTEDDVIDKK